MPDSTGSIGMGMPMRPVWHTSTSVVAQPTACAVSSHMRSASARPCSPVAALALPELSTTAAARPSARCRRLICTGAAATRLVVNTPAAVTGAPSAVATIARSGAPDGLMPDASPPASNPWTDGDAHGMSPIVGRRGGLGEAEHEVGVLQRLARRALHQVVERADGEHGAGAGVVADGDVRGVRAERGLGRRRPVGHVHERLGGVEVAVAGEQAVGAEATPGDRPRVTGGEDAPGHRARGAA